MHCGGAAGGVYPPGSVPAPGGPGGSFAASGVLVGKDANYDGVIERNEMGFVGTGGVAVGGGGGMACGSGAAGGGVLAPGGPGGAFAATGTLVGKDVNYDGVIEPNEMGFISSGGGMVMGGGSGAVAYGSGSGMAVGGVGMGSGMAYGGGVGMGSGVVMGGGLGYGGAYPAGSVPAPGGPGGSFAVSGTAVGVDANMDGVIERNEMGFIANGGAAIGMGGGGGQIIDNGPSADQCVRTVTSYKTVQVPVTRNRTRIVNYTEPKVVPYTDYQTVTKTKVVSRPMPKTIYVPVTEQVPYQTKVPVTKYKTIQIPKSRTTCEPHTKIITRRVPVVNVVPQPPPPCPPQPCN